MKMDLDGVLSILYRLLPMIVDFSKAQNTYVRNENAN